MSAAYDLPLVVQRYLDAHDLTAIPTRELDQLRNPVSGPSGNQKECTYPA